GPIAQIIDHFQKVGIDDIGFLADWKRAAVDANSFRMFGPRHLIV
ncbi:hypothetical protein AAULR_04666, partial [Lacticaseibacillus rhamnosus MTCC 5462]